MGKLGFDDYVEPLTIFINRHRENEGDRTSIRDPILKRGGSAGGAIDYGTRGVAGYGPMYHHHPPPPPPTAADHAAFYGGASGFYRDEGSTWGVVLFAESAGQLFLKAKDNGLCFFQWDCK